MTKPHEEEWEYDQNRPECVAHDGGSIARFRDGAWDPTPHDEARARLASKAPKMARALLRSLDACYNTGSARYGCADIEVSHQCADCQRRGVLREAGVLE